MVTCLDNDNADISNTALTHVADLALLMSEGMSVVTIVIYEYLIF